MQLKGILKMTKSSTMIGSLAQGMNIIDIVSKSDVPLKFTDIQEQSGISKSNLYKYLNTLTQLDLLYRDRQGSYSLGFKLIEYGNAAMKNQDITSKLTPYFKEISSITNMSTSLSIWLNDHPVITNIWNTNYGINIGAQIGTKLPLLSAGGKIFAAYANNEEVFNWIKEEASDIPDFSESEFQQELKEIRKSFVAFAKEPLVNHVSSIGLPILNYKNEIVAAVAIIGFSEEIPKDPNNEMVQKIISICKEMSYSYGYRE